MSNNPYPGLRPFRAHEERYFLGRDIEAGQFTTRVGVSPFTVLFARSGVGKSSFLTCRLMPLLENDSSVVYHNEWGAAAPQVLVDTAIARVPSVTRKEKPVVVLDQFEDIFKSQYDRQQ